MQATEKKIENFLCGTSEIFAFIRFGSHGLGWFKIPVSSQTEKLMATTKFSDYLGLNHYKNAKN